MMKFGDLEKWRRLKALQPITFPAGRVVRLSVSTPRQTTWLLNGEFFGVTTGMEVIEFASGSPVELKADQPVLACTPNWAVIHLPESGEPSFVRVAERSARNPEMERIAYMAAMNATRRTQLLYEEERRELIARAEAAGQRVDHETGEVMEDDDDGEAEQSGRGDVQGEKTATTKSPAQVGDGKRGKGSGGKSTAKTESGELSDGDDGAD